MPLEDCYPDLWADPEAFSLAKDIDPDAARQAILDASWILWVLTYRRFSSKPQVRLDSYRHRSIDRFRLASGPVDEIFSVKLVKLASGETKDISWVNLRGGLIKIGSGCCTGPAAACGCVDDQVLEVVYRTRPNLPPGADRAVAKLAYELFLAGEGQPCALPDRITSVTRQGVSWTLLDPMDFLKDGLTGLGTVDAWVSAANGRGVVNVIDPLTWLELAETEIIGCEDWVPT